MTKGSKMITSSEDSLNMVKNYKNISQQSNNDTFNNHPIVECPYCHSINTKKISGVSKAGNVAMFGIFAMGKVSKQFHCNNCKADF